ncbi:MAG: asparagine synthase B [Bacteriovoracaceae bacterium]|nr:asparagine synthase B [Bacteriovoracaceae bacterium]
MCGFMVYTGAKLSIDQFKAEFKKLSHRGPDNTQIKQVTGGGVIGFHRLSIMDLSSRANGPLVDKKTKNTLVCNGEVYNYKQLKQNLPAPYSFQSGSDCEVILPLYAQFGIEKTALMLDAEFAFVIHDEAHNRYLVARDPIGIRPLFYGYSVFDQSIVFASEAKSLTNICKEVQAFPPGHYYDGFGNFICYQDITKVTSFKDHSFDTTLTNIKELLVGGVKKRLVADAPIGFLLSGGLDSSLVCSIASKLTSGPIETFAIGMDRDPIDLKYAKDVANFIGSNHHEIIISKEDVLEALREVIYYTETWDITTIRASIGMYLICKYIRKNTDIKVLLTGEISDELFGYKYTDFAPSPLAFLQESQKRVEELYMYDVLRADRCISANSLEARVPFGDLDFVKYVMSIPPELKMNHYGMGKYLLRKAFDTTENFLPQHILYREKAAFSDAVGHTLVDYLKEYAEASYTTTDLVQARRKYPIVTPFTKESLMYRDIFESLFPMRGDLIKGYWMPNRQWQNCDIADPSARYLPNYGASGM